MTSRCALVTGASGFVGSHVVRHLIAEGWVVHVVARPRSDLERLPGMVIHRVDQTIHAMRMAVREARPDVVLHLASCFLAEHEPEDIQRLVESNLLFGTHLAEAMSQEGVKYLVNTSTNWQHYENRDFSPVNLYAATKQAFEDILQYYVEARGLRVITLKLFDTYGRDDPRPKLLNLLKRVVAENHPLQMTPGEQRIDLVHIEDVARAFLLAANRLLAGAVDGHDRYAVASGRRTQVRAIVKEVEKALGRTLPIVWGGRPYRPREVMRPWEGGTLPGWQPSKTLEQGLQGMVGEVFLGHE